MAPGTITREKILDFVRTYRQKNGYAPALREIAQGCGIKSPSAVQFHLDRLERDGAIRRSKDKSRSITLLVDDAGNEERGAIPILGTIAAGHPISVPDAGSRRTATEWIEVQSLAGNGREDIYALRVRGNSMVDALIGDGDIVIMQAGGDISNGDVAACWLKRQQEVTLKKIYFERDRIRLQPCNPYMMPIYERADNVEVQGKLIGVIRKCSPVALS
ncbi:MAG: transcriptional repressor LexA [Syntrophorhabdales bacterium]|jgi:repressor LexA